MIIIEYAKSLDGWFLVNTKHGLIDLLSVRSLILTHTQLIVADSTQTAHVFAPGHWNE